MSTTLRRLRLFLAYWLVLCSTLALFSVGLGILNGGTPGEKREVAELLISNPEMSAEEALASLETDGRWQSGGAFVAGFGVVGSFLLCALVVVPVGSFYMYLRRGYRPEDEIQTMPRRPREKNVSKAEEAEGDDEGDESAPPHAA